MALKSDMKILVIDDMATMRKIIKNMLGQIGFKNITEADDGATAWPMIQEALGSPEPYEFIVSDWNMPNMDGLTMLQNVRASDTLKAIPVLMVTAEAKKENIVAAAQAGASGYIVKPFTASTLDEKLQKIFQNMENKASA